MCGENYMKYSMYDIYTGSPPRVRGKLKKGAEELVEERITPACAGKTKSWHGIRKRTGDHPRVCGENE